MFTGLVCDITTYFSFVIDLNCLLICVLLIFWWTDHKLLSFKRHFIHDADKEKELLLGHVSMILDMVRIDDLLFPFLMHLFQSVSISPKCLLFCRLNLIVLHENTNAVKLQLYRWFVKRPNMKFYTVYIYVKICTFIHFHFLNWIMYSVFLVVKI